jgi:ATP-dependent helicase HrpA
MKSLDAQFGSGLENKDRTSQQKLRERIHPEQLPVFLKKSEIMRLLDTAFSENKTVLLQGETGSGKSVLLPGMIRELFQQHEVQAKKIISIQPRRDAAFLVSKAVAAIEDVSWGENGIVGCSTSEAKESGYHTEVSIVTTDIALRYLSEMVRNVLQGNKSKEDIGAIIVDEFHENSVDYHLIMGMLKLLKKHDKAPLTVLTSATLDKEKTQEFFGIEDDEYCLVEGRKYPVEKRFLSNENDDGYSSRKETSYIEKVVSETKEALQESGVGDILVFMPGVREINATVKALGMSQGVEVLALHGSLSMEEREYVLGTDPKSGQRRVIVSTNIAETSITLPRITTVVDSCRRRSVRYNPATGIYKRGTELISKDSAEQRAGRSGRVQSGICRRAVSEDTWDTMEEFSEAEIHRANRLC